MPQDYKQPMDHTHMWVQTSRKAFFFFSMSWQIRICCVTFLLATCVCIRRVYILRACVNVNTVSQTYEFILAKIRSQVGESVDMGSTLR